MNNAEKTAVAIPVAGLDADATALVTVTDGAHTPTHTYAANGSFTFDLTGFNDGAMTSSMVITDAAGNTKKVDRRHATLDTTAPANTWTYSTSTKAITVTTDTSAASVTAVDNDHPTQGFAAAVNNNDGTWTIATSPTTNIKNDLVTVTVTDIAGNVTTLEHKAPAGVAGEAINFALTDPPAIISEPLSSPSPAFRWVGP